VGADVQRGDYEARNPLKAKVGGSQGLQACNLLFLKKIHVRPLAMHCYNPYIDICFGYAPQKKKFYYRLTSLYVKVYLPKIIATQPKKHGLHPRLEKDSNQ
jgi:hypothetical protein